MHFTSWYNVARWSKDGKLTVCVCTFTDQALASYWYLTTSPNSKRSLTPSRGSADAYGLTGKILVIIFKNLWTLNKYCIKLQKLSDSQFIVLYFTEMHVLKPATHMHSQYWWSEYDVICVFNIWGSYNLCYTVILTFHNGKYQYTDKETIGKPIKCNIESENLV